MPMLMDIVLDGEFSDFYQDDNGKPTGGEFWEYNGRMWLLDNGQVLWVGSHT